MTTTSVASAVSATVDAPAGPSGQSALVLPPAPKIKDFDDNKSFAEAKVAWYRTRGELNRRDMLRYESLRKRHLEWLKADSANVVFWESKVNEYAKEKTGESSLEDYINEAKAAVEEKDPNNNWKYNEADEAEVPEAN
ncbi:hypothetical protein SNK03_005880 [Fusarium graminearum]